MATREYSAPDAQPIVNYGHDGSALRRFHTNASGDLYVIPLSLLPTEYDYTVITYDANQNPLTIVFKTGGASGTVVMTVTMTYDANQNLETRTIT